MMAAQNGDTGRLKVQIFFCEVRKAYLSLFSFFFKKDTLKMVRFVA